MTPASELFRKTNHRILVNDEKKHSTIESTLICDAFEIIPLKDAINTFVNKILDLIIEAWKE